MQESSQAQMARPEYRPPGECDYCGRTFQVEKGVVHVCRECKAERSCKTLGQVRRKEGAAGDGNHQRPEGEEHGTPIVQNAPAVVKDKEQTTAKITPAMLTSMIQAQEAVIHGLRQADSAYYAYWRRWEGGECDGKLLTPSEFHAARAVISGLYASTNRALERVDMALYQHHHSEISRLERLLGA
jgi:hypothetical protein